MKKHLLLSITIVGLFVLLASCYRKKELSPEPYNSVSTRVSVDHKLDRIKAKIRTSPSTVKVAFTVDSESDLAGNASNIPITWATYANNPDEPLYGFNNTNLLDFGVSGKKLARFLSNPSDPDGYNDLVASNPDLIIICGLTNDLRQNITTAIQGKVILQKLVDSLIADLPNADIILRMPNCFLTTDPTSAGYVLTTNPSGTITYYASVAIAAQAQTDSIYKAYTECYNENESRWDHVALFNSMDLIFGTVCPATDPTLHSDQIHPKYPRIVEEIVKMIGNYQVYDQFKADSAWSIDTIAPWNHYNMALRDTAHFELIYPNGGTVLTCTAASVQATRSDLNIPPSIALTGIHTGDIISYCDSYFVNVSGTLSTVTSTRTRLTQTMVSHPELTAGKFYVYRRK